jgi:poly(hydroxyalkanoate) granule-associated protein
MVSKQIKSKRVVRAREANEAARKFWLAGLGAVSLAQKQGEKVLNTLVEEGEDFKARAEKFAATVGKDARRAASNAQKRVKGAITPIKQRATKAVREFEGGISERIGGVLGRFGVPSKSDITELLSRVSELNKQVKGSTRSKRAA